MARIDAFFRLMNEEDASDLHLSAGCEPRLRTRGDLSPVHFRVLESNDVLDMLSEIVPERDMKRFAETGDIDFSYELAGVGRFRGNCFRQSRGVSAVLRRIADRVQSIQQLGLPPILRRFAGIHQGLVVVTGPTGSGKSTTLAAILDHAVQTRRDHVVTIEDPIEFRHESGECIVNHRQVGRDSETFASALRAALRQDPDIIMVGEMRDLETISLALQAACTGHLVLTTLHTPNAVQTVDRIVDVFPPEQQQQVRVSLSECLRGVVAQNLFKRADASGRVAAIEVMVATPAVSNLIREGKTFQLENVVQTGGKLGMRIMDDAIADLLDEGLITAEEALEKCIEKKRFVERVRQVPEEYRDLAEDAPRPKPVPV